MVGQGHHDACHPSVVYMRTCTLTYGVHDCGRERMPRGVRSGGGLPLTELYKALPNLNSVWYGSTIYKVF